MLRITNLRVNAAARFAAAATDVPAPISVTAYITAPGIALWAAPLDIAFVVRSVIASLRSTDDSGPATQVYSGCTGHNTALAANPAGSGGALDLNLKFTEGFSYAFRERLSQSSQAVPGYGYFAESGFYNPNLTGGLSNAGLADNGTRFIARFSAVPAGVHLFVTVSPSPYGTGGVYVIPDAHLVSADGSGAGIANDTSATASVTINGKSVGIAPVTLVDGAGEAAWEIRRVDPNAAESLSFGVLLAYAPGIQPGVANVSLSYAPIDAAASTAIPRFIAPPQGFNVFAISCAGPLPDLTVGTISAPLNTPAVPIDVSAVIHNQGAADAGPFAVQIGLYRDAAMTTPYGGGYGSCPISGLAAGGQTTCDLRLYAPGADQSAAAYIGVIADSSAQVIESNENNNHASKPIQISACTYSLPPSPLNISGAGGPFSFSVSTQQDCSWRPIALSTFLSPGAAVTGSGTAAFSAAVNPNTTPRTGLVQVASQVLTMVQAPAATGATLGGVINAKTGAASARVWGLTINNSGTAQANSARVDSLDLAQTNGPACKPVVQNTFPVLLGNIPAGGSVNATLTIDFSACAANAAFRVTATLSADKGATRGSIIRLNQFR